MYYSNWENENSVTKFKKLKVRTNADNPQELQINLKAWSAWEASIMPKNME